MASQSAISMFQNWAQELCILQVVEDVEWLRKKPLGHSVLELELRTWKCQASTKTSFYSAAFDTKFLSWTNRI